MKTSIRFILGALSGEMLAIARALEDAGLAWQWGHLPFAGGEELLTPEGDLGMPYGSRLDSGELEIQLRLTGSDDLRWYRAADLRSPRPLLDHDDACRVEDMPAPAEVFNAWVGCRPRTSAGCLTPRERNETVIAPDMQRLQGHALSGSVIGQLSYWARHLTNLSPEAIKLLDWSHDLGQRVGTAIRQRLEPICETVGAVGYDMRATLMGQTQADPNACLRHVAEMSADRELARLSGKEPLAATAAIFLDQVEAAKAILMAAPKIDLVELEVRDLLDHPGPIPALTVAAACLGIGYVKEVGGACLLDGWTTCEAESAFERIGLKSLAETGRTAQPPFRSRYRPRLAIASYSPYAYDVPVRIPVPAAALAPWIRQDTVRVLAAQFEDPNLDLQDEDAQRALSEAWEKIGHGTR